MTLEQCKAKLKPLFDVREKQEDLDDQFVETAKLLKDLGKSSMETALRVVSAVKADPDHGENSPLYAAMGYVRKSDRRSGLFRRGLRSASAKASELLKVA